MLVENVRERNKFIAVAVTGITGLIWPAYHMLFGTILDRLGGNFWVRSEGVLDTLCLAFSSHFPIIWQSLNWPGMERALAVMLVLSGPVAFLIFEAGKKSERDGDSSRTTLYRSLYAVAGTVAVAAGLDKLWPISTERNFIVILPAVGWGGGIFYFYSGQAFPASRKNCDPRCFVPGDKSIMSFLWPDHTEGDAVRKLERCHRLHGKELRSVSFVRAVPSRTVVRSFAGQLLPSQNVK